MGRPLGFAPEAALQDLGLPHEGQGWRCCSCLGHRRCGSSRYSGGWQLEQREMQCSRRVWQLVLANTLQYPCLENPCPWQATIFRAAESDTTEETLCAQAQNFFAGGSSAPGRAEREGGAAAWLAGTLAAPSVQGHGQPPPQELRPDQSILLSLL